MIAEPLAGRCGDDRCSPPAPVVSNISISDLIGNTHPERWEGLLDTAANRTAIPIRACKELGLVPVDHVRPVLADRALRGELRPLYQVRLNIHGLAHQELRVYGIQRPNILLGRDLLILTGLFVLLDYHRLRWVAGRPTWVSRLSCSLLHLR